MLELAILGLLAWACYKSRAFDRTLRIIVFCFAVVGMLILFKVGFVGVFFTSLLEIPVGLFKGVFGIIYNLLFA